MGMDIYAHDPIDPENNYWRSSIGNWSKLGGYVYDIAGDTIDTITPGKAAWFSNDGDLFDEEACTRIAAEVRWHIEENGLPENPTISSNPTSDLMGVIEASLGANIIDCSPRNLVAEQILDFCAFLENSRGIHIH